MPYQSSRGISEFLSLRHATFRLGERLVFPDTTWSIKRDEQWAIIGPNGSGKSLLMDGLQGRLPLVGGELFYGFKAPGRLSPEEAIGHVAFEDRKSELHGEVVQSRWTSFEEVGSLRVSEFLSYERVMDVNPFEIAPDRRAAEVSFEARLGRSARLLQVDQFWSRRLLTLSNGERQRVQITRALAKPLRLLILDEPYVGLDRAAREYFHGVLERLLQTRLRVLLVTARPEDLPKHVSHFLQLDDCRVAAAGTRASVLSRLPRARALRKRRARSGSATKNSAARNAKRNAQDGTPELVSLRNVTVRYGSRTILNNFSWIVREGENWALVGPNGSGKTTLLSLIQGDNPQAYANDITVLGYRRGSGDSVWRLKKQIGWVSPELQLHFSDSVTVLNAVLSGFHETIGLFEKTTERQRKAALHWLRRFDLQPSAKMPLYALSAGWQRMVLLARALVKSPRLLILDEPCQGLDPEHTRVFLTHLDALLRAGAMTAIFVTHRAKEIPPSITLTLKLSKNRGATISESARLAPPS